MPATGEEGEALSSGERRRERGGEDEETYILTPYASEGKGVAEAVESRAGAEAVVRASSSGINSKDEPVLKEKLEGLGEDFKFNLKLLEERDEELSRSDLELYKMKVRYAEQGAEVNDLREQVLSLKTLLGSREKRGGRGKGRDRSDTEGAVDYVEFDKDTDASSEEGASTNEEEELRDNGGRRRKTDNVLSHAYQAALQLDSKGKEGSASQEKYLSLLEKYESVHADYVAAKYEIAEMKRRSEKVDFGNILDSYFGTFDDLGNGVVAGSKKKDVETQLTFLKHELECEQHLKYEALRSLELERKKNREVKKSLLKDYEAKCLSLMRHLKSVEDSFVQQQRENDRLREEHARKGALEARIMQLAEAVSHSYSSPSENPQQVEGHDAAESGGEVGEDVELTATNIRQHLGEGEGAGKRRHSADSEVNELVEDALTTLESAIVDQGFRIKKLELESNQREKMAARSQHRLKASIPLVNLAYAYCSTVHKASNADLKEKYPHVSEVKGAAKSIMRYMKKSDKALVPYKQLGLNIEPLESEARRLKNSGVLGLAVFSLNEEEV
ncbi:hypothetical protein HOP50_05g39490 [Chloropicon primus]|uniref:Uncharacterized protein n=1 Tax=Chloropicon primus TaxID=1764295 RepID=A0A5B8MQ46_9CHLO|nr:hypothetical protein A3770_05p39400 [Chloropicon primus]UPR00634.1 hypothetical protein HOP50_05g39490 [Chloropicon primus]|eukprot:QDZ21422.1 hypothetical protein A3770_05p39400 [Chloropicon primus]